MSKIIMGIQVDKRHAKVKFVQDALTEFGCSITTRLGLHQAGPDFCSERGLIILEMLDDADKEAAELEKKLKEIEGVVVKKMVF